MKVKLRKSGYFSNNNTRDGPVICELCGERAGVGNKIALRHKRLSINTAFDSPFFSHMKSPIFAVLLFASVAFPLAAGYGQDRPKNREEAEALVSTLKFQQGEVILKDGLATLKVPDGLRFLNGHDAWIVLVKLWNNPPMPSPLGLIMPSEAGHKWKVRPGQLRRRRYGLQVGSGGLQPVA